jgi:hypothetical protein
MPYSPPSNDAVNFSEEGSYSPPSNDAVNFSEEDGGQTLSAPATTVDIISPAPSIDATATATLTTPTTDVQVSSPSPTLRQYETLSAPVTEIQVTSPSPSVQASGSATLSASTTELQVISPAPSLEPVTAVLTAPLKSVVIGTPAPGFGTPNWIVAGYPFGADTVESDAKTLTLSAVVARYRLGQIRKVREAAEKVGVVVDDNGRFKAVDRSRVGNKYTVKPPVAENPPRETTDMLVADYSEERVSKQENKSEVELVLQRPASRDKTGDEPSQTRETGEWLLEFHSGAIATRRITPERTSAVETAKDVESLQLVLTAEQTLVLETSATYPDAVSVVEVPDGTNLAQDNSTDDRQTVTVTAPSGKEEVLGDGTYVVDGWTSTRLDSDSYEVSLDLRPKA